jgi:8-amino-7-oxononanoate synthase
MKALETKRTDLFAKTRSYRRAKDLMAAGLYPYFIPIEGSEDTEVMIEGRRLIMVGSNNYLGLTHHPKVLEAAENASRKYGTGCTGSRFLNGTIDLHEKLEADLAEFTGHQAALVFSTGYQTNLGIIQSLVGRDDTVFIDKLDHASIIDGCTMSSGETVRFRHNDPDDLDHELEHTANNKKGGALIAVDGVFSMEGDIAPLPDLCRVARKHGARVFVDEAHSLGVIGPTGAGAVDHFGLQDQVDVIMGTFSKSFASIGGFVASETEVIHYLKHHARALMFSAAMPPYAVATVHAALQIIKDEPERRMQLLQNAEYLREGLKTLGFDTATSETPIIPVVIGDPQKTFAFWRGLYDNGVFSNCVVAPAVPPNACRIRTSLIATHTREQLDRVIDVFHKVGQQFGIVS